MADLETLLAKMVSENRQSRERFETIASRTVSAISKGDTDALTAILTDATNSYREGNEGGTKPLETGNIDGVDGDASTLEPPG